MVEDERLREALLELQFLRDREARTLDETRALLDCLEAFTNASSAGDALASIFVSLRQKVGAALSVLVARNKDERLAVVASDDPAQLGKIVSPPFDPLGRARNISSLQMLGPWRGEFQPEGFKGMIATPAGDGLAFLTFREPPHNFRKEDLSLVQRLSGLATQALRNSEIAAENELLAATIAGSSSGFAISDATDDSQPLIYVNEAFERLSGYSADEVLGQNCRFLSAEPKDAPERVRLREAVRTKTGGKFLLRNRRKSGEEFWNELTLSPVLNTAGEVKNLVATQSDVSEIIAAEAREEELTRELFRLQRQEAIAQLTAGVAHDFNNLLSAINGSATLIGMSDALPKDVQPHLDRITAAGAQSAKLVSKLLDVGASSDVDGVFELTSVLSDLPAILQASLPGTVELTMPSDPPPCSPSRQSRNAEPNLDQPDPQCPRRIGRRNRQHQSLHRNDQRTFGHRLAGGGA